MTQSASAAGATGNAAAFLLYQQVGGVVTLTMNDPARRNPLTGNSAIPELLEAIDRINRDASVRAVVWTGAGPAFCSGGDIRDMKRYSAEGMHGLQIREEYRTGVQRLAHALFNIEVPVIAAVNGPAIGAGFDLACMCDIRLASEAARFGETFVKLGLISGDGGAWVLPRVIGLARASEMSFTGEVIDAVRAAEWGLVSRVLPADQLLPEAARLAQSIAVNPPQAVRLTKRLLREGLQSTLGGLLETAASYQALCHQTAEHQAAVDDYLARRQAARAR